MRISASSSRGWRFQIAASFSSTTRGTSRPARFLSHRTRSAGAEAQPLRARFRSSSSSKRRRTSPRPSSKTASAARKTADSATCPGGGCVLFPIHSARGFARSTAVGERQSLACIAVAQKHWQAVRRDLPVDQSRSHPGACALCPCLETPLRQRRCAALLRCSPQRIAPHGAATCARTNNIHKVLRSKGVSSSGRWQSSQRECTRAACGRDVQACASTHGACACPTRRSLSGACTWCSLLHLARGIACCLVHLARCAVHTAHVRCWRVARSMFRVACSNFRVLLLRAASPRLHVSRSMLGCCMRRMSCVFLVALHAARCTVHVACCVQRSRSLSALDLPRRSRCSTQQAARTQASGYSR